MCIVVFFKSNLYPCIPFPGCMVFSSLFYHETNKEARATVVCGKDLLPVNVLRQSIAGITKGGFHQSICGKMIMEGS